MAASRRQLGAAAAMSDVDSDSGSEPDLDELTRRAAEAKLVAAARGDSSASDGEGAEAGDQPSSAEQQMLRAAERGDVESVRQLLREQPRLAAVSDDDGYTPLHRAAYNDHVLTAQHLLAAGADPAARTGERWTPLHSAARWNAADCARLLLLHGADVNAVTGGGLTPLMVAASSADARDTCFLLLDTPGVRLDVVNDSGDTAADIAARTAGIQSLFEMAECYMTDI